MEKLSKFVAEQDAGAISKDRDIFKLFKKYTDKIIEEQGKSIEVARLLELEVAFLNFSIKSNPNNIEQVNAILESCVAILKSTTITNTDQTAMRLLVKLLSIPLQSLSIQVLSMNHYPELMKYMKFQNRRTVALQIVKAVTKESRLISDLNTCQQLIDFIMPLLVSENSNDKEEPYEFEEGQNSVARLVHLFSHPSDSNVHFELLMRFKRVFVKGGAERMRFTLPALIFALFKLSREMVYRA